MKLYQKQLKILKRKQEKVTKAKLEVNKFSNGYKAQKQIKAAKIHDMNKAGSDPNKKSRKHHRRWQKINGGRNKLYDISKKIHTYLPRLRSTICHKRMCDPIEIMKLKMYCIERCSSKYNAH